MVTAGDNHNKFYRMTPRGDTFVAEYGRIGNSGVQSATYPISQFEKKYREKIRKGYTDQTHLVADLIVEEKPDGGAYAPLPDASVSQIVARLQRMANTAIQENYTISANKVTQAMVDEAQSLLIRLLSQKDVSGYNEVLLDLFRVIPRRMRRVSDYLAGSTNDFARIIQREQDLLDVMRGQVVQKQAEQGKPQPKAEAQKHAVLEALGLEFEPVTDADVKKIRSCLGSCVDKYHQAWRVKNRRTQKRFDDFVTSQGGIPTKLLWHGSRNENWWSIVQSGLVLRPTNAVITGKMFGYGLYFATKARKSLGYTSLSGSYWARGSSSSAFMALYDVAYGKPYDVHSFDSKYHSFNFEKLQQACPGAHCLHAHEGKMLRNDEIIVYREDQTTIRYLVELR